MQASGGSQGTDTTLTVNNVAPSISGSSIQLLDTDETGNLTLTSPESTTSGFKVKFTVVDNNSCETSTSTAEISSIELNIFRSGVTSANCDASGDYDTDKCYPSLNAG